MCIWELPDFDAHEKVVLADDRATGLRAIIAIHSTHLGPASGGTRFWHYASSEAAITDALRLSKGMSYKNAMAGLPLGGGKAVMLADADRKKTDEMLEAFGATVETLGGTYVTTEDVGISVSDVAVMARKTQFVAGLPVQAGSVGGDPGPHTSLGVYLGIKAGVRRALGTDRLKGVRIALQGAGSVASGVARLAAKDGAHMIIADVDNSKAVRLAAEVGGKVVSAADIMTVEADVLSPCALGAILDQESISRLRVRLVAGGANNQLASKADGRRLHDRAILYAPDFVINAGGIINVCTEYLKDGGAELVRSRIEGIPGRLEAIWQEAEDAQEEPAAIAERKAQELIGR